MWVPVAVVALLVGIAVGMLLTRGRTAPLLAAPTGEPADTDRGELPGLVLEALASGVVVVDRDDVVLFANPAARVLGAVSDDRLASDELRALARIAVDTAQPAHLEVELPRGRRGAGAVAVTAVPLRRTGTEVDAGRVVAVALLVDDVTESRRLEAVRRDFVANVSHELKTPVGALILLAEAVQEAADDPEAVDRFAGRMQHEGQRLGRLVGELIALSRVQGADRLPDPDPVPVARIVEEAVDFTRLAADNAGIVVSVRVEDGLVVRGSETQLVTALSNLVDNAVSYSASGTRVAITARAADATGTGDDPAVEILVTDQGIGIAEADLDRVFERFFRVDPARSRATGGTGLGLAIVKHIVTNHGGAVTVWSVEGAGSTFTVRLPRLVEPVPSADGRNGSSPAGGRSYSGSRPPTPAAPETSRTDPTTRPLTRGSR